MDISLPPSKWNSFLSSNKKHDSLCVTKINGFSPSCKSESMVDSNLSSTYVSIHVWYFEISSKNVLPIFQKIWLLVAVEIPSLLINVQSKPEVMKLFLYCAHECWQIARSEQANPLVQSMENVLPHQQSGLCVRSQTKHFFWTSFFFTCETFWEIGIFKWLM